MFFWSLAWNLRNWNMIEYDKVSVNLELHFFLANRLFIWENQIVSVSYHFIVILPGQDYILQKPFVIIN